MTNSKTPILIDCDPGTDDVTCMLYLFAQPTVQVVGITPVGGNKELAMCEEISLAVCENFGGADIPVCKGSEVALSGKANITVPGYCLGGAKLPTPKGKLCDITAWDFIYQQAVKYQGDLEILVIGPHMNLAKALQKYPDLKQLIKRLVIMGGAAGGGNITPYAEYNFGADPEASNILVQSGIPMVVMPLEICAKAYITPQEIKKFAAVGKTGAFVEQMLGGPIYKAAQNGRPGCGQCDPTAAVYMVHPEIFTTQDTQLLVETKDQATAGKTIFSQGAPNAKVGVDLDRVAFVDQLYQAVVTLENQLFV